MNGKEILEKALQKARDNGSRTARQYLVRMEENPNSEWSPRVVCMIACFSHDFAEAFWGKGILMNKPRSIGISTIIRKLPKPVVEWKYHLQEMVLCKEPIMYLAKFLDE